MSSYVENYTLYQIANSEVRQHPFPHMLVRDVFEPGLYRELLAHLLSPELMKPIRDVRPVSRAYSEERFVFPLLKEDIATLPGDKAAFWSQFASWILGAPLLKTLVAKFRPYLDERFAEQGPQDLYNESMLVDDRTQYSLGPHSDSPSKVITVLFYLPADDRRPHLGTSVYLPKDPAFRCPGGPHHPFEKFDRVITMPYLPNTMFTFFKNDRSFHGVEPIQDPDCRRQLLFYDIKCRMDKDKAKPAAPPPPAPGKPTFTF